MSQDNNPQKSRLHFIDAMRAWAILMMLQGHFVSSLLSNEYKNKENFLFLIWDYFRGITAPVFFTVSGFVFTFILLKKYALGLSNSRVKKGLIRGFQLIGIGYLLQLRFLGLIHGVINNSFYFAHVLQCIGLSLILIIFIYLVLYRAKRILFALVLITISLGLLFFKIEFETWDYSFMPTILSNYFTTTNGSIFTIIPWFGYAAFGAFLSVLFAKYSSKANFYTYAIWSAITVGVILVFTSYTFLEDNYSSARLGDVLFVFAFFILFRNLLKNVLFLKIGQNTLSLYVIHSIVLYGSITGYGLSRYYYDSLTPSAVFFEGILFVVGICLISLGLQQKFKLR